jgi:hypothetical protein
VNRLDVRFAPLDELDDLPPPLTEPGLIRFCGTPKCRRRARPGGRHCPACHIAAVHRWRETHRRELNARRRDTAAVRDPEARTRDSARAKLAMAIRREKVAKGRCAECGAAEVTAYMADPARPLEVVWLCRDDRRDGIERIAADVLRVAERAAWDKRRAGAVAGLALLPAVVQAQLHAQAQRGIGGLRLSPDAPLYMMTLVRLYERYRDEHASGDSARRAGAAASETI